MLEGNLSTAQARAELAFRQEQVRLTFADLRRAHRRRVARRHGLA